MTDPMAEDELNKLVNNIHDDVARTVEFRKVDRKRRSRMSKWILQDGTHFFKQMTDIGPMATSNIFEAQEFETKEDAVRSPAMRHWSSFYTPVQVSSTDVHQSAPKALNHRKDD